MRKPNAGTVVVASLLASTIGTMVLYFKSEKEYLEETKERNETIETALKQTEEAIEGWKDSRRIEKARAEETLRCVTRIREALSAPGMHFDENIRVADNWLDAIEALAKNAIE